MLDPTYRQIYLDEIRPPEGYRLDRALATTFSLDLMSLLMAPISMALDGYQVQNNLTEDPIILLEALQQAAGRFVVFCQQGRVLIPKHDSLLYSYLENAVVEVQPWQSDGVFHAKTWLLRFTELENKGPVFYRFLCLSRNLTFDRSWDTVLTLEGHLSEERKRPFSRNRPLAQFIRMLPEIAIGGILKETREFVTTMAEEILRVSFTTPNEFEDEIQFIPIGIPGYTRFPKQKQYKNILVMSPFLSAGILQRLVMYGRENVVISRIDSLDEIKDRTLKVLSNKTRFFFMETSAERPEEVEESFSKDSILTDLSGLHAKLIITEYGSKADVFTGSANATNAAFNGSNIEFVAKLSGPRKAVGINAFLGNKESKVSFQSMLRPYERDSKLPKPDESLKVLEDTLEKGRRMLVKSNLSISVEINTDNTYNLTLFTSQGHIDLPANVAGECYPISIANSGRLKLDPLTKGEAILFSKLTIQALTRFMAFNLTAYYKEQHGSISFVLNLPITGLPSERDSKILHSILSNEGRFIHYLLLILGTDQIPRLPLEGPGKAQGGDGFYYGNTYGLPLLEEMIRAFSRDKNKIDRIARLIAELKEAGSSEDVLPPGFNEVWEAFMNARQQE